MFWLWIILALMAGGIIGMVILSMLVASKENEIIAYLYEALREWVDAVDQRAVPIHLKRRYRRSVRALMKAQRG